jgi:hypothetical protein
MKPVTNAGARAGIASTAAVAAALFAFDVPAQLQAEGYQSALRALPAGASTAVILADGRLVYLDGSPGTNVVLDDRGATQTLLALPASVFGSFLVQVTSSELLFGESTNGDVWRIPFAGGGAPQVLANIALNYAAVPYDGTWALVSAKTSAAPSNDILALHLETGAIDQIAVAPGDASGPLAIDAQKNLYYATASTAFPPPPGGVDILRFDAAEVQGAFGPTQLTGSDATVVFPGLHTASSIALDADADLFAVDWFNATVVEIDDIDGPAPQSHVLLDYSTAGAFTSAMQFVRAPLGPNAAQFEPFQPQLAGALAIQETTFSGTTEWRFLTPARPVTVVTPAPVAAGPFSVITAGGPANGLGVMAWGAAASLVPEVAVAVGREQPLFWGFAGPIVTVPVTFDSAGIHVLPLANPGIGLPNSLAIQIAFVDAAGAVAGSTAPATFVVQ